MQQNITHTHYTFTHVLVAHKNICLWYTVIKTHELDAEASGFMDQGNIHKKEFNSTWFTYETDLQIHHVK